MKKQVMKVLRLAKKDGDTTARDTLDCIKKTGLMDVPMKCDGSCYEWTYFKWGFLKVWYNGATDEVKVWYDHNTCWTLCE